MIELATSRQENSKTYDLGGGKRQLVVSIGAIHYKDNYADKSEQWKDIDLTWGGNCITKAPYELTLDGQKFTLKDKKTGEVSTIELLDVKPAGLEFEVIPEFSAVRFQHILPSDKVPFEAKFKVTGKMLLRTRAWDDEGELELETSFVDSILTEKLHKVKDKLTGKVRLAKGNIRIDPTWQVGASSDDCRYRKTTPSWSLTVGLFYAGNYSSVPANCDYGSGARFLNITIPKVATIDTAKLTLRCRASSSGTGCKTYISAEKVDDAPTFADDAAAFLARYGNNTSTVVWDNIESWTAGNDYDSVDFKAVIQAITDRAGWASGQAIVIFWEDYDSRSDVGGYRDAQSYDGDSSNPPKLVVTYILPTPVTDGDLIGIGIIRKT